jgi:hypothetical protein
MRRAYVNLMNGIASKLVVAALAAITVIVSGSADARHRRSAHQANSTSLPVDASGTPIIMKGYQADQGRVIPRVGTPVVVPPPHTGLRDLPARQLLQPPAPPVYAAPTRPTFSDKVTNCIHSYPLNSGIGNNPTDRNAYIGQCVNQ